MLAIIARRFQTMCIFEHFVERPQAGPDRIVAVFRDSPIGELDDVGRQYLARPIGFAQRNYVETQFISQRHAHKASLSNAAISLLDGAVVPKIPPCIAVIVIAAS